MSGEKRFSAYEIVERTGTHCGSDAIARYPRALHDMVIAHEQHRKLTNGLAGLVKERKAAEVQQWRAICAATQAIEHQTP